MINERELKLRADQRFEELLEQYDDINDVPWKTQAGRKMTIGTMADSHISNAIAYFDDERIRSVALVETLESHIQENPDDHGNVAFADNIGEHLDKIVNNTVIRNVMNKALFGRRMAALAEERPLTLVDKVHRMRESKRAKQLEEFDL